MEFWNWYLKTLSFETETVLINELRQQYFALICFGESNTNINFKGVSFPGFVNANRKSAKVNPSRPVHFRKLY